MSEIMRMLVDALFNGDPLDAIRTKKFRPHSWKDRQKEDAKEG